LFNPEYKITPEWLFILATEYMGYKDFGVLHQFLCERLCEPRKHTLRLFMLPRGFFKTSLFSYTHNVALALENPDIRVLQVSGVLANAKAMVANIGKFFTHNELFRDRFKDYCPKNAESPETKWTESVITLPNRTAHHAEGTFEAFGADSTIVSRHYDYMKFDDLVTDENSTTREQMDKIINFFEECQALSDRRGHTPVDVFGTTWDDGDLYAHLQGKENIEIVKIPATYGKHKGIILPFDEGESIFPERYSTDDLKIFEKEDPHTYAMFYELDPVPYGDRTFTDFTYYEELPGEWDSYRKFMTVDPAPTKNPTSSYSAINITATDDKNYYVVLSWRDKLNPNELIDNIWKFYFDYNCEMLGIESYVYQVALVHWLQERLMNDPDNKYMRIVELKHRGQSKNDHIAALAPYVNLGKYKFKKSQTTLIHALSRFPKAKWKDEADAMAYQLQLVKPSSLNEAKPEVPWNSLYAWKKRMKKLKDYRDKASYYVGN